MTAHHRAYRSGLPAGRDGFGQLLRAEWTKFRTVRGWVIGLVAAALVIVALGLFAVVPAAARASVRAAARPEPAWPACHTFPIGPGGEAVTDSFYFVHQPLTGDGSITVRVTSLTGVLTR